MAGSSGGLCEELFDENGDANNTGLLSSGMVRVGVAVHVHVLKWMTLYLPTYVCMYVCT